MRGCPTIRQPSTEQYNAKGRDVRLSPPCVSLPTYVTRLNYAEVLKAQEDRQRLTNLPSSFFPQEMSKTDDHDELPPHYADFPADPVTFSIGSQETAPLVNLTEVQSHLRLLAAFDKLKDDVQKAHASMERLESEPVLDSDAAWVVFINKAAYRFDKFMSGKWEEFPRWDEAVIPPLDVVMVWHTYLLVSTQKLLPYILSLSNRTPEHITTTAFDEPRLLLDGW